MKIALHDNALSLRGTTVALYDYANFLSNKLNYECIILYNKNHQANDINVINSKFVNFKVYHYDKITEIDGILLNEKCDYLFSIKGGKDDGVTSSVCKNLIMAVAANVTKNDIHGDKYFVCSPWLSEITGIEYVPHMINLPLVNGDLREELNIPQGSIVFGRNGGYETFDLPFVKDVIRDILDVRSDYFFLFQNTQKFINHDRVIFLDPTPDMEYKVKFINTCDAHLHARNIGESFGLTCGEFSTKNKPVITWNGSPERNHINILGEKAILYNNYTDLMGILLNFDKYKFDNWNCYGRYTPEVVMEKFVNLYLNG